MGSSPNPHSGRGAVNRVRRSRNEGKFIAMSNDSARMESIVTVDSGCSLNSGLEMVLQNGEQLPERTRHILDVMVGESRRLTRFVQVILDVSQLEAGWISLNLGPVAVRPLLERAAATVLANSKHSILWHIQP